MFKLLNKNILCNLEQTSQEWHNFWFLSQFCTPNCRKIWGQGHPKLRFKDVVNQSLKKKELTPSSGTHLPKTDQPVQDSYIVNQQYERS